MNLSSFFCCFFKALISVSVATDRRWVRKKRKYIPNGQLKADEENKNLQADKKKSIGNIFKEMLKVLDIYRVIGKSVMGYLYGIEPYMEEEEEKEEVEKEKEGKK